jgi:hypothetical protein
MGIIEDTPPDYKGMLIEGAKNVAKNYVMDKMGLEGIKRNAIGSIIGANTMSLGNPVGMGLTIGSMMSGSSLPDAVKGIAGLLRGKRASKAIQKDINRDNQGQNNTIISPAITNMQPSARDIAMGGGGKPSKTTPAPSKTYSSPAYGGGPGGIHSGY